MTGFKVDLGQFPVGTHRSKETLEDMPDASSKQRASLAKWRPSTVILTPAKIEWSALFRGK